MKDRCLSINNHSPHLDNSEFQYIRTVIRDYYKEINF